ncbi:hypothetical protein GGR56DRAFT_625600 [Xylariaceae sp. FL0804]|nr:hypothetical protein GGR56DRAFT_625600 [Xylariaceae sp. FL0804]
MARAALPSLLSLSLSLSLSLLFWVSTGAGGEILCDNQHCSGVLGRGGGSPSPSLSLGIFFSNLIAAFCSLSSTPPAWLGRPSITPGRWAKSWVGPSSYSQPE